MKSSLWDGLLVFPPCDGADFFPSLLLDSLLDDAAFLCGWDPAAAAAAHTQSKRVVVAGATLNLSLAALVPV